MMQRKTIVRLILVLFFVCFIAVGGLYLQGRNGRSMMTFKSNSQAATRTQKQAQPITDALARYYLKHDKYPDKIQSLVPEELKQECRHQRFLETLISSK